jgi:Carboxypeptidase regulatory-like domain
MRRACTAFVLSTLLGFAAAPAAFAQKTSGDITGTVTDDNGAIVPGATVTATCPATGLVRSTVSNETGGYRLADLPVCVYKVVTAMQGFKTVNREVQVAVSTTTKADFRLQIGQLSEESRSKASPPSSSTRTSSTATSTRSASTRCP